MTIRKKLNMPKRTKRSVVAQTGLILLVTSVVGCSSVSSMMEPDRVDYKSASKAKVTNLEVPPDLTKLQGENRYAIPDANRGVATASGFNTQQVTTAAASAAVIAPKAVGDIRVERAGNQRWLVVNKSPEVLWPQIKDFWQDSGFLINIESPEAGLMETDWAENRAKVNKDFIRNTLGKLLDSAYDTGERDKFRTRLERGPNGTTEIYISHRGAVEVVTGAAERRESTVWTGRASDPALEVDFLARLMTRLGGEQARAKDVKAVVVNATPQPARAKLVKGVAGAHVEADEGFDRTWRRVGLALDRVGFTVEDRDRAQGLYFVRYVDQDKDAKNKSEAGFFAKLFSSSADDMAKAAQRYRVSVKEMGATSHISVLNAEGRPEISTTADKILTLLTDQLK